MKNLKKKITELIAVLLVLATATLFTACSKGKKTSENGSETTAASSAAVNEETELSTGNVQTSEGMETNSDVLPTTSFGTTGASSETENGTSSEASENGMTQYSSNSDVSSGETKQTTASTVAYYSKFEDTRLAKYLSKFNFSEIYIKMTSESRGNTATKEYGAKGGAAYSSIEDAKSKIIYLSTGKFTYMLWPLEKKYTVQTFAPFSLTYEYDGCIGAGSAEFLGQYAEYEAFYDKIDGSVVCHMFDKNGKWLGYEIYVDDKLTETDYISAISSTIPSHLFFSIPSDYSYYYSEPVVTWPSEWDD